MQSGITDSLCNLIPEVTTNQTSLFNTIAYFLKALPVFGALPLTALEHTCKWVHNLVGSGNRTKKQVEIIFT